MTENIENNGCSQMNSAEHEEYAKASRSFNLIWKERDSAQPKGSGEPRPIKRKTDKQWLL